LIIPIRSGAYSGVSYPRTLRRNGTLPHPCGLATERQHVVARRQSHSFGSTSLLRSSRSRAATAAFASPVLKTPIPRHSVPRSGGIPSLHRHGVPDPYTCPVEATLSEAHPDRAATAVPRVPEP
jgi:hypothetical protein